MEVTNWVDGDQKQKLQQNLEAESWLLLGLIFLNESKF